MHRCLIIVGKEPVAGLAKTRLAAGVGGAQAVQLYRAFLDDTLALAKRVPLAQRAFSFWPPQACSFFRRLDPDAVLLPQRGDDFGSRLLSAFEQACAYGYDEIVLIGSDNPGLPLEYVMRAFDALQCYDVVLGPAVDGGYYLIGMRYPHASLFERIAWSTEIVAQQTIDAARDAGLALASTPLWYDIDTADDLDRLHSDLLSVRDGAWAPTTLRVLAELTT